MLKVSVPLVAAMIAKMHEVQIQLSLIERAGRGDPLVDEEGKLSPILNLELKNVGMALGLIELQLGDLHLNPLLNDRYRRLKKIIVDPTKLYDPTEVNILFRELQDDIMAELVRARFFMIDPSDKELYEQKEPPFGLKVSDRLGDANPDIAATARCLALEEWTASVFHSMRLEIGLSSIEAQLKLPLFPKEQWHRRIKAIEDEIKRLRNLPPQQRPMDEEMTFYSEAATNFRYFKDAWRNHVSHARTTYDEPEARTVWNHVRLFMQSLAAHLP